MSLTESAERPAGGAGASPGHAAEHARRHAWAAIGATSLAAGSLGISIGALGPSLPLLHTHLSTPLDQLGLLFAANFAGSVVATLVVGPLLDRRAARPLMVVGVALTLVGQFLLPLATTFP